MVGEVDKGLGTRHLGYPSNGSTGSTLARSGVIGRIRSWSVTFFFGVI